jgi:hypothetical protein
LHSRRAWRAREIASRSDSFSRDAWIIETDTVSAPGTRPVPCGWLFAAFSSLSGIFVSDDKETAERVLFFDTVFCLVFVGSFEFWEKSLCTEKNSFQFSSLWKSLLLSNRFAACFFCGPF